MHSWIAEYLPPKVRRGQSIIIIFVMVGTCIGIIVLSVYYTCMLRKLTHCTIQLYHVRALYSITDM